jgi:hypothetical protein
MLACTLSKWWPSYVTGTSVFANVSLGFSLMNLVRTRSRSCLPTFLVASWETILLLLIGAALVPELKFFCAGPTNAELL